MIAARAVVPPPSRRAIQEAVTAALRAAYGDDGAEQLATDTGQVLRTVRNHLSGEYGPDVPALIAYARAVPAVRTWLLHQIAPPSPAANDDSA